MATSNRTRRFKLLHLISIVIVFFMAFHLSYDEAMMQTKPPYNKEPLLQVVRLNALSTEEIVGKIQQRGVEFQTTPEVEAEFRAAGAKPELIEALRVNYRPPSERPKSPKPPVRPGTSGIPPGSPLAKNEIITMLQGGVPAARVEKFVEVRGVSFSITPEIVREITAAGGNRALIGAITEKSASPSAPTNTPDYDDLTDQAQTALDFKNNVDAVRLLQQAIKMDATKPTAYQLLGYAQLYGGGDISSAEQSMRMAIERKGAAVFRAYHDHGTGVFTSFCTGKLQIMASKVHYKADQDGKDTFETDDAKIKEAKLNRGILGRITLGIKTNSFHIEVIQPNGKTKNYNFAPATGQKSESQLILSLIQGYQ